MNNAKKIPIIWIFFTILFFITLFVITVIGTQQIKQTIPRENILQPLSSFSNNANIIEYQTVLSDTEILSIEKLINYTKNEDTIAKYVMEHIHNIRQSPSTSELNKAKYLLKKWQNKYASTPQLQLLQATIEQYQHQFDKALITLDGVLKSSPNNAQAWITKALIHQERQEHKQAIGSCYLLAPHTIAIVATACLSSVLDAAGNTEMAFAMLKTAIEKHSLEKKPIDPSIQQWAFLLLAELSIKTPNQEPDIYFKKAQQIDIKNHYLNKTYNDYINNQHL